MKPINSSQNGIRKPVSYVTNDLSLATKLSSFAVGPQSNEIGKLYVIYFISIFYSLA